MTFLFFLLAYLGLGAKRDSVRVKKEREREKNRDKNEESGRGLRKTRCFGEGRARKMVDCHMRAATLA